MTAELKRYQLRFPSAAAAAAAASVEATGVTEPVGASRGGVADDGVGEGGLGLRKDAGDDLPPWVTSSEVMSPLLTAYDARIQVGRHGWCVRCWLAGLSIRQTLLVRTRECR